MGHWRDLGGSPGPGRGMGEGEGGATPCGFGLETHETLRDPQIAVLVPGGLALAVRRLLGGFVWHCQAC